MLMTEHRLCHRSLDEIEKSHALTVTIGKRNDLPRATSPHRARISATGMLRLSVFLRHEPTRMLMHWSLSFHVDPDNYYLHRALTWLLRLDGKQSELFAVGTELYALLFVVEGVGLWLIQAWPNT